VAHLKSRFKFVVGIPIDRDATSSILYR
jgi:hypothetical protein